MSCSGPDEQQRRCHVAAVARSRGLARLRNSPELGIAVGGGGVAVTALALGVRHGAAVAGAVGAVALLLAVLRRARRE